MPQKGTEKRRSSEKMIYCKEIAPFETPTFSKNVGEFIARATRAAQKGAARRPKTSHW
jgi:hypothetical protein